MPRAHPALDGSQLRGHLDKRTIFFAQFLPDLGVDLQFKRRNRLMYAGYDHVIGDLVEGRIGVLPERPPFGRIDDTTDRKSTRLNSSHVASSYAVFCLKK